MLGALFVPFLLVSLIPQGLMPVATARHTITLVICHGDQAAEMQVDPVTMQPVEPSDAHKSAKPCDWLNAQIALDLPGPVAIPIAHGRLTPVGPVAPPALLVASRATGLPPATGPPSIL